MASRTLYGAYHFASRVLPLSNESLAVMRYGTLSRVSKDIELYMLHKTFYLLPILNQYE